MTSPDSATFGATLAQLNRLEQALFALKDSAMPDSVARAIRSTQFQEVSRLRELLDKMSGVSDEDNADMVVRLEGFELGLGFTPASILSPVLDLVRSSLLAVTSYVAGHIEKTSGRYPSWIQEACDLRVTGFAAGSLKILLVLPPDRSLFATIGDGKVAVQRSISLLLQTAGWVDSQQGVLNLYENIADERLRRILLIQLLKLTPTRRDRVRKVELSGKDGLSRISHSLSTPSLPRIRAALGVGAADRERVAEEGALRRIDFDTADVELRQRPNDLPDIRCVFDENAFAQALEPMFRGSRVMVFGKWDIDRLGSRRKLLVDDIQVLSTPESEANAHF